MTEHSIRQVPVKFPFTPYKVQEEYMKCVIECLQKRVNGVLESPTGTGKTLSLLCSSLAWLQTKKAQVQVNSQGLFLNNEDFQEQFKKNLQNELATAAGTSNLPNGAWGASLSSTQIIYASRTHAQLTQAIKELKRTSYSHVKAGVLGSRDQLCLHPDLAEEQGTMKTSMCHAKLASRTCHYFNNFESKKCDQAFMPADVLDIEDMVKFGHKTQCCPYYMAKEMMNTADIVFMPYNYIINPQTRRQQKINLFNAVVLLDEAHNVERICEESASVHISSTDVALCITEVGEAMKKFLQDFQSEDQVEDVSRDFSSEDLMLLKTMFLALEQAIDDIELKRDSSGGNSLTENGSVIFDLLAKAEIHANKFTVLEQCLVNVAQYMSTTSTSSVSRKGSSLFRFADFLKVVAESWRGESNAKTADQYYKVYIEPEKPVQAASMWSNAKAKANSNAKVINFWCFNPGFAMRSLVDQGLHCIILTSGTLAPLQATVSELGIPIAVQLENPHVIQENQINVSVVCKGPTGKSLLSNYSSRDDPDYMCDLGYTLVNFSRIVPEGMLVFFTSYSMMSKILEAWKDKGIWSKLNDNKPVFVEPQRREALLDVMCDYTTAVEADSRRGALLLAVLRGKVSEGMDFADAQCRAVLVLGLPYTPFKDPRIVLKKAYADQMRKENPSALSGKDWYELDAVRAVNQAVGRVIRHAHDFGAIIFCDPRFGNPGLVRSLSSWLRPHLTRCDSFGLAYSRASKFFKALGLNPPVKPTPVRASFDMVESKVRIKNSEEKVKSEEKSQDALKEFLDKFRSSQPRSSPQTAPRGLLDALDTPHSQQKIVDIKKAVAKAEDISEGFVEPAPKKRKIKVMQLSFDSSSDKSCDNTESDQVNWKGEEENKLSRASTSSASADSASNLKREANKAYLQMVKEKLSAENFLLFKEAVVGYANGKGSYEKTMMCLVKVIRDKEIFLGFKRYIKQENTKQFESLCKKMFG